MLIIKKGNILDATENIICHQVNCQGFMGGGLALQLANKYQGLEEIYKKFCKEYNFDYEELKGKSCCMVGFDDKVITNCFTQKPNSDTDYEAIKVCFTKLYRDCKQNNWTMATPYKMGCGIANGNWETVESILIDIFTDCDLVVYKYE